MSEHKQSYTEQLKHYISRHFENDNDTIDATTLDSLIEEFAQIKKAEYDKLKADRKLSFGKYRGYTVKELSASEKGREYLSWLLGQTWFAERNSILVDEIRKLGIKRKKFNRTLLY